MFTLRLTDQHKDASVLHAHCIPAESPNLGSFWLKEPWTQLLNMGKFSCTTLALAIIRFIWSNDIFIVLILFSWEISPGLSSGTTTIRFTGNLSPQTLSLTDRESVPEKKTARNRIKTVKKYTIMYIYYSKLGAIEKLKSKHSTRKHALTGKSHWIWSQSLHAVPSSGE